MPLALVAGALVGLAACGGGGGGVAPTDGTPVFKIASTTPADGTSGIPLTSKVLVAFSRPVDVSSVNYASMQVGVPGGAGVIAGTTEVENAYRIRWTATDQLAPDASHVVLLGDGIRSLDGAPLTGNKTFTFRTASDDPDDEIPTPDALQPANGTLHTGRRSHRATLLNSGQVLLTGGFIQGPLLTDTAELFDPAPETFALTPGKMHSTRASHTATLLLDGRVLMTGGWRQAATDQLQSSSTAEIFDPATGAFTAVGSMGTERVDHAALRLPDGRVLVSGGSRLEGTFLRDLDSIEVFDPATGLFTPYPTTMVHTRATHGMVDLGGGRVLLAGGSDTDLRYGLLTLATQLIAPIQEGPLDQVRFGAAYAQFPDKSLSVSGGDDLGSVMYVGADNVSVKNSFSGLRVPREYHTATLLSGNRILVAGGFNKAEGYFLLSSCDLIVQEGGSGSLTYSTNVSFPVGMVLHTATLLHDGRVLFCGGLNQFGGLPELDVAFLLSP